MTNPATVQAILKEAKVNQWPYPKTFEALKEAGVLSYQVDIDNYHAIYTCTFGVFQEPTPVGYEPLTISPTFSKSGLIEAIQRHIQKTTNYLEFLADIAANGVSHYKVNMEDRTVSYCNKEETQSYQETVPSL